MKKLLLLSLLFPFSLFAQPTSGPYPTPGGASGVTTNGGTGINNVFTNLTIVNGTNTGTLYGLFTNAVTLWVDSNGSASGIRGYRERPYALISQAIAASSVGDTIHVMPGVYGEGTNQLILKQGQTLFFEPGARIDAAVIDAVNPSRSTVLPADNTKLFSVFVNVTNNGGYNVPIGSGQNDSGFTNVIVYNPITYNDSDGYCTFSSNSCQWTLINPVAYSGWDCYNTATSTNHVAKIINPLFYATNSSGIYPQNQHRGIIVNQGNVTVIGGLIQCSDITSSNSTGSVFLAMENNGLARSNSAQLTVIGTYLDESQITNSGSIDCQNGTAKNTQSTFSIANLTRSDLLPLITKGGAGTPPRPILFSSHPVANGDATNVSIYTVKSGASAGTTGTGIFFPNGTNVAISIASNEVFRVDATGVVIGNISTTVLPYRSGITNIANLVTSQAVVFSTPFDPSVGTNYSVWVTFNTSLAAAVSSATTSKTTNGFTIALSAGITGTSLVDYGAFPYR